MRRVAETWITILAIVFSVAFSSNPSAKALAAASESAEVRIGRIGQNTIVAVTRESSEGFSNEDLNVAAAEKIGAHTLDRFRHHLKNILRQMNSKDSADDITESTVLLTFGKINLISTRLKANDLILATVFMGIRGSEFVRVSCTSPDGTEMMIVGKCNDALIAQFGVSVATGKRN